MTKTERRFAEWIERNRLPLFCVAVTILALFARLMMFPMESGDYTRFLQPWFEKVKANGGLRGLGTPFGDYNMLYRLLIALFTYIPADPLWVYKGFSVLFDFLLAGSCALLVRELSGNDNHKAAFAYAGVLLLPTVCLDSSCWAQCDSVYVFFCVLSLLMYLRGRYVLCFLCFGFALSFKLQTVFLLPFYVYAYIREKRFSVLHCLIVPLVLVATALPCVLAGRPFTELFAVYKYQMSEYPRMMLNYAGVWNLVVGEPGSDHYNVLAPYAVALALTALGALCMIFLNNKARDDRITVLRYAFLFAFTCVMFLPAMHERYDYIYMILGLMLAVLDKKTLLPFAAIVLVGLQSYSCFLFRIEVDWTALTAVNIAAYAGYLACIVGPLLRKRTGDGAPGSGLAAE